MGELFRRISTEELLGMMDEIKGGKRLLLDVREPREHESLRIPHSMLLPPSEIERRWQELDSSKGIVLYCRSGGRSVKIAKLLMDRRFRDVSILEGGLNRWRMDDGPMEEGRD